jgi:hypothetical protein
LRQHLRSDHWWPNSVWSFLRPEALVFEHWYDKSQQ